MYACAIVCVWYVVFFGSVMNRGGCDAYTWCLLTDGSGLAELKKKNR